MPRSLLCAALLAALTALNLLWDLCPGLEPCPGPAEGAQPRCDGIPPRLAGTLLLCSWGTWNLLCLSSMSWERAELEKEP